MKPGDKTLRQLIVFSRARWRCGGQRYKIKGFKLNFECLSKPRNREKQRERHTHKIRKRKRKEKKNIVRVCTRDGNDYKLPLKQKNHKNGGHKRTWI